jgi:hypothetical protein
VSLRRVARLKLIFKLRGQPSVVVHKKKVPNKMFNAVGKIFQVFDAPHTGQPEIAMYSDYYRDRAPAFLHQASGWALTDFSHHSTSSAALRQGRPCNAWDPPHSDVAQSRSRG